MQNTDFDFCPELTQKKWLILMATDIRVIIQLLNFWSVVQKFMGATACVNQGLLSYSF